MTPQELRALCLDLPSTAETFPFSEGLSVFKTPADGKIFALSDLDAIPFTVSVKCDPEDGIALRAEYPQITPGYHLNKKHWITLDLTAGLPDDLVEQVVNDSYTLVRPRRPRALARPEA